MLSSYLELPSIFYHEQKAEKSSNPSLLLFNHELANELGFESTRYSDTELASFFSGNEILPGSRPLALCYAGHQFGHFVPRLGDGRALLIAEMNHFDIQLKGSGRTLYSRRGDGKSALGPVIREYIVSEAMHQLGIPSSRALAAVASGDFVQRETLLPGGIFTRVAKSHLRIGTFEWVASQKNLEALKKLADYSIKRLAPEFIHSEEKYLLFFRQAAKQYLKLVSLWMGVGFIHGVMNTDNSSLSGETLDFGPCAFMDQFNFDQVFSSIDEQGRYRYSNQPKIAFWNLSSLAHSLSPLIHSNPDEATAILENEFLELSRFYDHEWISVMGKKLGLKSPQAADRKLIELWLHYLHQNRLDYTQAHLHLKKELTQAKDSWVSFFPNTPEFKSFLTQWSDRLSFQKNSETLEILEQNNPIYIPRNHLIEAAIEAAYQGDLGPAKKLIEVLKKPYLERAGLEYFETPPGPEQNHYQTFCGT